MRRLSKTVLATVAAATLISGIAAPAAAWRGGRGYYGYGPRYHHYHDGFGNFLAGALVVGGIAAVASAASSNNRDRTVVHDTVYQSPAPVESGRGYDTGPGYGTDASYSSGSSLDECSRAVERQGESYGDGRARIRDIRASDDYGRDVRYTGTVAVDRGGRGIDDKLVRFTCTAKDGRVQSVRFDD